MATVFETVRSAADELRAAGVDTPQHDAKLLLAEAFHTDLQHVDKAMLMGDGVERLAEKEDAEPATSGFCNSSSVKFVVTISGFLLRYRLSTTL